MEKDQPIHTIVWPSDEEMKIAFETYAVAVGKVAHAWNFLHERLGRLFVIVTGADRAIALAIWYSTESDRTKQKMLKDAVTASADERWMPQLPKAKTDLLWLADRVISLTENRNNAIHAPCELIMDWSKVAPDRYGPLFGMAASYHSGHDRAQKLRGKEILVEFDWCERWAEELSRFTERAESALISDTYPWPDKPAKPDRKPRSALGLPLQPRKG